MKSGTENLNCLILLIAIKVGYIDGIYNKALYTTMKCSKKVLLLVIIVAVSSQSSPWKRNSSGNKLPARKNTYRCSNHSKCPTWFTCDSNKTCQCGDSHDGKIVCDDEQFIAAVLDCNCVTYDETSGSTFVGSCFYNCMNVKEMKDLVYHRLPMKPEKLSNESVCSHFHKTGLLCGDCEERHSPLVFSYNLSCVECPDGHKNWWKFILAGFVPLTIFYFFVVLFNINVTSSRLHGVVWISQVFSVPIIARVVIAGVAEGNPGVIITAKVFLTFYSFWNLDLFYPVLPDLCLNVTTLQAFALEYLIALYPFVLILLTYFIIELHDRKCAFIVTVWKPFHKVLTMIKTTWDVHTSIIDSFTTFFLLSYMKILSVTTNLLVPTQIYKLSSNTSTFGLYYSPSVEYFGDEHLPFAVLAILMLILFVLVPIVVSFLYTFRFFQKFLSIFPFNWHFLHAFMDSFQGSYKDGTEPGTLDCRWFSTTILFGRILLFIVFAVTLSRISIIYIVIILVIFLILQINIQPFKKVTAHFPLIDPIFLILLSLACTAFLGGSIANMNNYYSYNIMKTLLTSTVFIPFIYISILIGSWLFSRRRWINKDS